MNEIFLVLLLFMAFFVNKKCSCFSFFLGIPRINKTIEADILGIPKSDFGPVMICINKFLVLRARGLI